LAGAERDTVGGVESLFTAIATAALVVELFEVSVAMAVSVCVPFESVRVFSEMLYGAEVTWPPVLVPSTRN
jgi:hypothetical protein